MEALRIPSFDDLVFSEQGHIYTLADTILPSVTTLMKPLSQIEYESVDRNVLDAAAKRGTSIHNSIKDFIRYGINTCNDEFAPYMNAFIDWFDTAKPIPVGSEMKIYHKLLRYAGMIDFLAYIDGELVLIDIKTTYQLIDKLCRIQLEAYSQALLSWGIEVKKKIILHLGKDGTFRVVNYKTKDADALRIFMSCRNIYDYMRS